MSHTDSSDNIHRKIYHRKMYNESYRRFQRICITRYTRISREYTSQEKSNIKSSTIKCEIHTKRTRIHTIKQYFCHCTYKLQTFQRISKHDIWNKESSAGEMVKFIHNGSRAQPLKMQNPSTSLNTPPSMAIGNMGTAKLWGKNSMGISYRKQKITYIHIT